MGPGPSGPSSGSATEIEDIAWPREGTNFIFECWKYLSRVIDTDEIPTQNTTFFYRFSKQQNSAIKVVNYRKMPVTKMLWNSNIKL